MVKNSKIEWTDHTFNPWWGCVKVSEGCKNCYAETMANRFGNWWGPTAERRFFGDKHWAEPLKWNAQAERDGVLRHVRTGGR
ncbi:phage Gp37/Gp68 family protein [bacterium]|nr:phage Gp37/Gp68 family protein [bacterium]